MQGLIDLAPPGIDELAAVIEVTDALESSATRSGRHGYRAERPCVAPARDAGARPGLGEGADVDPPQVPAGRRRSGQLGAVLLQLSQGLGRLRGLLADPARTSFIAVTRAAALPRAESRASDRTAARLHIHVPLTMVIMRSDAARARDAAPPRRPQSGRSSISSAPCRSGCRSRSHQPNCRPPWRTARLSAGSDLAVPRAGCVAAAISSKRIT